MEINFRTLKASEIDDELKSISDTWAEFLDNYLISSNGVVYSKKRNRILKGNSTKGYKYVCIYDKGEQKTPKIHKMVAEAFIPNPNNYPVVNHKDGNPSNNNVDNLEWCTYSYNTKHAYDKGLQKPLKGKNSPMYGKTGKLNGKSKPVIMLSKDYIIEREFDSCNLAILFLRENGFPKANSASISLCCNKKRYKSAYGKIWRFKNEF